MEKILLNYVSPMRACMPSFTLMIVSLLVVFFSCAPAQSSSFQSASAPNEEMYLIYVHGRIIENKGPNAVSDTFGRYEFYEIKEKLQSKGHLVTADIRRPGTLEYVDVIVSKVSDLLSNGVSPDKITIVGFSKGGYMALRAAAKLQNPDINYVILAGCIHGVVSGDDRSADGAKGRFLSMVDASDDLGFSCRKFFNRNPQITERADIIFKTGEAHGLFYKANPMWINPVLEWSSRD